MSIRGLLARVAKMEQALAVKKPKREYSCRSHMLIYELGGWSQYMDLLDRLDSDEELTEAEQEALEEAEESGLPLYPPSQEIDFRLLIEQKVREALA